MDRLLHFFWFDYHRKALDRRIYETSNVEIQKWAERSLEKHFAVHSTSCVTQGRVTLSGRDVLVGHPTWDSERGTHGPAGASERDWVRDNRLSESASAHPNTYILMPWVPEFPHAWTSCMPCYEAQLEASRLIFGICGPIWYERTLALDDTTVQGRVKSKLVRLDMCVNVDALQCEKAAFNPMGRRKVLHVSNLGSYKGFDLLLESTRGVTVPSIASHAVAPLPKGEIAIEAFGGTYRINNLGAIDNTDRERIASIVREHDLYIHTASMDAQATTTLEFGARGLVPLVTRESGFESDAAIYLTRDAERNREIVDDALHMTEDELCDRSARVRADIREKHSWGRFYDTMASHIRATCEG